MCTNTMQPDTLTQHYQNIVDLQYKLAADTPGILGLPYNDFNILFSSNDLFWYLVNSAP